MPRQIFFLFGALLILLGVGCGSNTNQGFTGPAGVFLTSDKGESWVQKSVLPTADGVQSLAGVSVYRLYDDPQDPDAMYWASRNYGLFYTYNNGDTWQHAPAPLNKGFVYSVAIHPQNKCILFATTGFRVYRSTDCSRSWEEVYRDPSSQIRITSLEFHSFEPYELFASKLNGNVLVSKDLGASWAVASDVSGSPVHIESDPFVADRLYMSTRRNGLYRSDDRGRTWESLTSAFSSFAGSKEYRKFIVDRGHEGHLYWVSTYGILRSIDSGDSWEALNLITSPGSAQIYGIAVNPENDLEMYYTAVIGNRTVFYSSQDGGVSWTTESFPSGQLPTILRIHPENPSLLYLGMTIPPEN